MTGECDDSSPPHYSCSMWLPALSERVSRKAPPYWVSITHDLQFRNVVRDDDGILSIIDFETAIKVDPSNGCCYERCPDDAWIEEIKPCSVL